MPDEAARIDVWANGEKTEFVVEGDEAYPVEEGNLGWVPIPLWEADEDAVELLEEMCDVAVVDGSGE